MSLKLDKKKSATLRANRNLFEYASKHRGWGFLTDALIFIQCDSIPANKLVLSCCSSFFEQRFQSGQFELNEDHTAAIVEVDLSDDGILRELVDYMYSGSIEIDDSNVVRVLSIASYLKMNDVIEFCSEFLKGVISIDNALVILHAAANGTTSLQSVATEYLLTHFNQIKDTTVFKELEIEDLKSCLLKLKQNYADHSAIYLSIINWTKCDMISRMINFPDLLHFVDFSKLSSDFLTEIVCNEDLIFYNDTCSNLVIDAVSKDPGKKQLILKKDARAKLVNFGGRDTSKMIFEIPIYCANCKTSFPEMPLRLFGHNVVKLNDFVYCVGGEIDTNDQNYDINEKMWRMGLKEDDLKWENRASMHVKRDSFGCAILNKEIVVCGGFSTSNNIESSAEVYNPSFDKWRMIAPMNQARDSHALVSCNGAVYALGGHTDHDYLSSVESLDDINGGWSNIEPMQVPRRWLAAVNCNGVIYAIGGESAEENDSMLKSVEKYDAEKKKWVFVSDMNCSRTFHAAVVWNGKIYVVGGFSNPALENSIECYDPSEDKWLVIGETNDFLYYHSLCAL